MPSLHTLIALFGYGNIEWQENPVFSNECTGPSPVCATKNNKKNYKMEKKVYKLFGKVLETNKSKVAFNIMNAQSMQQGIFVPEKLCYKWLYDLFKENAINPNSTFYQSWVDVTSKTRWQLFLDQVKLYASTYGTNFEGDIWTPEHGFLPEFPYTELKVLESITLEELKVEITKLAYSNVAMSAETLTCIQDIIEELKVSLDIENIKNRELRLRMIPINYQFKDGQECLLWILWKWFNISMLVKNKETFTQIRPESSMLPVLTKNKEVLATVFYRNKDVFMQFKKCKELCHIINVIRKLAVKLHKPMEKSIWLRLEELSDSERENLFNKTPIFKLVQMYNVLSSPTGYYVIRNGKAYYKDSIPRYTSQKLLTQLLVAIIAKVPVVDSISLPKGIELAMPTSEKNFIGDIPLGSTINCADKNTMVGIYWRNEWGARDLDLHCRTITGITLGWNAGYHADEEIVFSGDMTSADPEASEVMWFKNQPQDSIVSVSEYNGGNNYKYNFFIAQEDTTDFREGYMVDPRNIIYKAEMSFSNMRDVTLGYFKDGKFVFHSCNVGQGLVPTSIREKILNHLVDCNYLTVRKVIQMKGIRISEDSEIKLTSKGDLINFFSGN